MKILQPGNKVTVRSDGTRTSTPKTEEEVKMSAKRRGPPVVGGINRGNKAAMDAAGMKKGGKVSGYKKGGMCR